MRRVGQIRGGVLALANAIAEVPTSLVAGRPAAGSRPAPVRRLVDFAAEWPAAAGKC
jgi:hypothetical protein